MNVNSATASVSGGDIELILAQTAQNLNPGTANQNPAQFSRLQKKVLKNQFELFAKRLQKTSSRTKDALQFAIASNKLLALQNFFNGLQKKAARFKKLQSEVKKRVMGTVKKAQDLKKNLWDKIDAQLLSQMASQNLAELCQVGTALLKSVHHARQNIMNAITKQGRSIQDNIKSKIQSAQKSLDLQKKASRFGKFFKVIQAIVIPVLTAALATVFPAATTAGIFLQKLAMSMAHSAFGLIQTKIVHPINQGILVSQKRIEQAADWQNADSKFRHSHLQNAEREYQKTDQNFQRLN